jgi:hypothetical protein
MRYHLTIIVLILLASAAHAVVDITLPAPQITKADGEQRLIHTVTLANEVASYQLVYDRNVRDDKPNEATSHWWGWTSGFIPIGMVQPSRANWYWQAFLNWRFDDEDLSKRPAQVRVVRPGGADALIEFAWDTPKVKASLFFGLASGSDKLLLFGRYEPKTPVTKSTLTLVGYPTGFQPPHNRAVTTALGTRQGGAPVPLDLTKERWVLYEDVTPGRPGDGSAGLLIGTPDAFSSISFPAGGYGIVTTAQLKPDARGFALGLYDFPSLPDFQQTRDYFRASADREAQAIALMAAAGVERPFPPMPLEANRLATIQAGQEKYFERPVERWRPDPAPLPFPWAAKLPGGPIKANLFCPRWRAWETMELGRRLQMEVQHLYFDGSGTLSDADYWPYAGTTGQGAIPYGIAMQRAVALAQDPQADLFIVATIGGPTVPTLARQEIAKQVQAGKGLLLAGAGPAGWPPELFKTRNDVLAEQVLAGLAWDRIPGFRQGDRGRGDPLVQAYDYGQGHVIVLNVRPTTYGALVPANDDIEGQQGALDRALAIAARAVMAAAKRLPQCRLTLVPAGGALGLTVISAAPAARAIVRVQDDLDRTLAVQTLTLPAAQIPLPPLPAGRAHFVDVAIQDAQGQTLGHAFTHLPAVAPPIAEIKLSPAHQPTGVLTPQVPLPQGGKLTVTAQLLNVPANATLTAEASDAFGRVVARQQLAAKPGPVALALDLLRPVTVCHVLDLSLQAGGREIAHERRRFTVALPYPYDDFTGLMWSYAGGDPLLRRTDRFCYDWGADMMDLCHVGGFAGARAAREFELSAQSGLRLIPYVTRLAGEGNASHVRVPCLHDPKYLDGTNDKLRQSCMQAAPFTPAAYTLGDENYLFRGNEVCHSAESVAAFQQWLQTRYADIAALNAAWGLPAGDRRAHATFADIKTPMLIGQAAEQTVSFAPWLDHKLFMSEAFSQTHDTFRSTIRTVDPPAKVGYDGFLGFNWQSGYDFERLAQNLELNQVYTSSWIQGELVRAFKRPDALTGKWGNSDADTAQGWHAFPWHCLLDDDNSVWWWTSWGCDYIPFNPDLSQSQFGQWFFEALRETTGGPGKLLLHAERELSPVAVLHSQPDFLTTDLLAEMPGLSGQPFAAGGRYLNEEMAMMHGIRDAGYQYRHLTPGKLTPEHLDPAKCRVFFMPYASCLSDAQIALLRDYVQRGGTLVADGRVALLTAEGKIRDSRPLDDLFGVKSPAGPSAVKQPSASGEVVIEGTLDGAAAAVPLKLDKFSAAILEPGVRTTTGAALGKSGDMPVLIVNKVGEGRAILLNMPLTDLNTERAKPGLHPTEAIAAAILQSAGVPPPAVITAADGATPLCLNTVSYSDGPLRYLAVMQDFRVRGLPQQKLTITLPQPAFVYDLRAGKPVALGQVKQWPVAIGRGYPLVYALLPYQVTGIKPQAPAAVSVGMQVPVKVALQTSARGAGVPPAFHVVRLDVFAPGQTTPHRQYSQNLSCPKGNGSATIPFALSDTKGQWRLVWRDVASGVKTETVLQVK